MNEAKTAFVTGGTGFLGINLIRALCDQNWSITALHRATSDLTYIKDLPIKLAEGSITEKATLCDAIPTNASVVFHLAGDTNLWSKKNAQQTEVNVTGTQNLIDAAIDKGAKKFIHTSSISAWGSARGNVTEETPQCGGQSWINYEKSKFLGEQVALENANRGIDVTIINPGSIVGAFDKSSWAQMFFAIRNGELPGVPPGTNSFVHVNDVVQALIIASEKGKPGERYLVTGTDSTLQELAAHMAKVMGLAKVPKKLPKWLLMTVARLGMISSAFTGKEPTITPEKVELLSRKGFGYSNDKALAQFNYTSTPWQQGVQESYDWLIREGLL
ncbi:MAG: NAD-dependent epimerase/dehydratase family protein [Cyclobacteriaceae bacterium]